MIALHYFYKTHDSSFTTNVALNIGLTFDGMKLQ